MSALTLLINLAALGVYGYSTYYMNSASTRKGMESITPPELNVYGVLKFLTYQCLLIQLFSTFLHVVAHFVRPLRPLRDLVFTTLAYPVGSIVVYTFWAIWMTLGRELIMPQKMDAFYPTWLNHATHTLPAIMNILMAGFIQHKYTKNGVLLTLFYNAMYMVFLHVIKAQTGLFPYGFLNEFNDTQRIVYFAFSGFFAYLMYKSGQFVTFAVHGGKEEEAKRASGGSKQKNKQKQK